MAFVQYADTEFTGPGISDLPQLPAYIPVGGYDRRFHAQSAAGVPDGVVVNSWADTEVSGTFMTAAGSGVAGATSPVAGTVGKHKTIRFDGVANALGILYLANEPYTFTMAFYLATPRTNAWLMNVVDSGQFALFTNANNNVLWYGVNRATTAATLGAGWHIITVVAAGSLTTLRVDDVVTAQSAAGGAYERKRLALGGSPVNSSRAKYDVAEVIHWPTALSAAEVGQVHASLKARYGI